MTSEEPLCPCRRIWQNCPCHGCFPAYKSNLSFMFPSALERVRRHLVAIPAGCDGWVWSPVRCPNERGENGYAIPRFRLCSAIVCDQWRLRGSWAGALEEATHTHIQGGATSWDSSGGEEISQRLRCCEPSGFRGDAWVCEFHTAHHSVNASVVVSQRGSGGASPNPVHALFPSLFCTLVM